MLVRTARDLVGACHPLPTVAVTTACALLAAGAGTSGWRLVTVVGAVLTGQLSIGWANDWIDAARDRAVGRTDKPVAIGVLPERLVAGAALAAACVSVPLSFAAGPFPAVLHLTAVAAGWSYNWPLKATALSVVPYLVAFSLLPAFVVIAAPERSTPPWWLLTAGALLGAGAHFANALPDFAQDARTGIRGLPHRIGRTASRVASVTLLLAAGGVLVAAPPGAGGAAGGIAALAVSGALLIGSLALSRWYGERLLFVAALAVALVDVVLLLTTPL